MATSDIRMGQFVLTRRLGYGGMGEVYLARETRTGRPAAVKVIRPGAWLNHFVVEREVAALRSLRHPGIVRVLHAGVDDGTPWYAMELVEGRTLAQFLSHLGPGTRPDPQSTALTCEISPPSDAVCADSDTPFEAPSQQARVRMLGWLVDVSRALAYIHGEGLVHGDLKPANVMITRADRAVLIDFGLAGIVGSRTDPASLATAGLRMGTAGFLAPERIRGDGIDARADLYALGCLIYLAITGRCPFGNGSPEQKLRAHLSSIPLPPSVFADAVAPELDALVASLLDKDPARRPAHAGFVASALEAAGARGSIHPDHTPTPQPYLYHPSFVGRRDALETLERLWRAAVAGRGGVTVVRGPAGAGKTRVIAEFLRRVRTPQTLVCAAHADAAPLGTGAPTSTAPLIVWDRILTQLGAETCCDALLEGTSGAEEACVRLLRAITGAVAARAQAGPVMLALDDLQWADSLSLDVLAGLADSLADVGAMVIAAGTEALKAPNAHTVCLEPLDDSDMTRVLCASLGVDSYPAAARRVVLEHAAGSPFLAVEWLRLLVRRKVLTRGPGGGWVLGAGAGTAHILAVVSADSPDQRLALRLHELGPQARALAGAAAVLGNSLDAAALGVLTDRQQMSGALRELLRLDVLREAEDGRLIWSGEDLRRAVYDGLTPEGRRTLHQGVADGLADQLSPVARAHHVSCAGDSALGRRLYLSAARASQERWAIDHAAECYEAALSLGERDEVWLEACVEFLRHTLLPRDHPETVRRATDALRVAQELQDDGATGHCHSLLAECALMAGYLDEARREDTIALRYHARAGNAVAEVLCLLRLARVEQLSSRLEDAERLAQEAARLAARVPECEGQVLAALASIMSDQGRIDEALTTYERALERLLATGARRRQCAVQQNVGAALANQGDFHAAMEAFTSALVIAVDIGDVRQQALIRCNIGVAHANLGNHEEALEHNRHAQALYRAVGQAAGVANTQRVNGQVLVEMGRPAEALDELADVFAFFWDTGQRSWCGDVLAYIAWARLMLGDTDEALRLLDCVDQLIAGTDVAVVRSLALRLRARAQIAAGDIDAAHRALDEAEFVASAMGATDAAEDIESLRADAAHAALRQTA